MWSASTEPCVVEVMEPSDLMDKLVYIATNPVKDGLVARVRDWQRRVAAVTETAAEVGVAEAVAFRATGRLTMRVDSSDGGGAGRRPALRAPIRLCPEHPRAQCRAHCSERRMPVLSR